MFLHRVTVTSCKTWQAFPWSKFTLAKMFMNNMARIAKNIPNKLELKSLSIAIYSQSLVNQKGKYTCGCNSNEPNSEKMYTLHSAVNSQACVG